ncbi:hypothetical protein CI610_03226 [invertebrate metagenome]|uniref:Uncharacterized protein n=1 Tax=invertebrate metagenome TaxID=1711999 RepID=A0A2H9T3P2_9ZZZZ
MIVCIACHIDYTTGASNLYTQCSRFLTETSQCSWITYVLDFDKYPSDCRISRKLAMMESIRARFSSLRNDNKHCEMIKYLMNPLSLLLSPYVKIYAIDESVIINIFMVKASGKWTRRRFRASETIEFSNNNRQFHYIFLVVEKIPYIKVIDMTSAAASDGSMLATVKSQLRACFDISQDPSDDAVSCSCW